MFLMPLLLLLSSSSTGQTCRGTWIDLPLTHDEPERGYFMKVKGGQITGDKMAYWTRDSDGSYSAYLFDAYFWSYSRPIDAKIALSAEVARKECNGWGSDERDEK